jgi:hypothetical protein
MTRLGRFLVGTALMVTFALATAAPAAAGNYVVYLHGRNMQGWIGNGLVWAPAGWQHIGLTYNGSERLQNQTARDQVKWALQTYCRGGNQCVLVAYSAGVNRLLLALDDLIQAGTPATNVLFVETMGSAAGGTEVAAQLSKWYVKLLAKITGQTARIDADLTPNRMRGDFGYLQNRMPVAAYQTAGGGDICQRYLGGLIKVCGNSVMPGGYGDGAVPVHSACGFNAASARSSCCGSAAEKYTNMLAEQCGLFGQNHTGMFGVGVVAATARFGYTLGYATPNMNANAGAAPVASFDDIDSTGIEPTFAGVLNLTPPDTDGDGRMDSCRACDPSGCGHCYEFSIAEAAYPSTCNWLPCRPTVSGPRVTLQTAMGYQNLMGSITASGSQLTFREFCGGTRTVSLAGGVTVSGGGNRLPGTCSKYNYAKLNVYPLNSTQLDFRHSTMGSNVVTFAGATLYASEAVQQEPYYVDFYGNQMIFYARSGRFGSYRQMRVIVASNLDLQ